MLTEWRVREELARPVLSIFFVTSSKIAYPTFIDVVGFIKQFVSPMKDLKTQLSWSLSVWHSVHDYELLILDLLPSVYQMNHVLERLG